MKKNISLFLFGVAVGFGIPMLIGVYLIKTEAVPLVSSRICGDTKIFKIYPSQRDNSGKELHQSLIIERNGKDFIRINQSKQGDTKELFVFNDKSQAVVYVDFTENKGQTFKYGLSSLEHKYPYQRYIDFDMNGQIDYIIYFDEEGQINSESAYFMERQEWESVSESEKGKRTITVKGKTYKFIPSEGWKETDLSENSVLLKNESDSQSQ